MSTLRGFTFPKDPTAIGILVYEFNRDVNEFHCVQERRLRVDLEGDRSDLRKSEGVGSNPSSRLGV